MITERYECYGRSFSYPPWLFKICPTYHCYKHQYDILKNRNRVILLASISIAT